MTNMVTRSPLFFHTHQAGQQFVGNGTGGVWWLLMAPGVALTLVAVAILVWPELLAYMVASVLLFTGVTFMLWSWRLRQVAKRLRQEMTTVERHTW
jgi:hypothetical protein